MEGGGGDLLMCSEMKGCMKEVERLEGRKNGCAVNIIPLPLLLKLQTPHYTPA